MERNTFNNRDLCSTELNNLTIRVPNPISSLVCVVRKLFDEKGSLKNWLKERKKERSFGEKCSFLILLVF
jgi:hypothetical protein